MYKKNMLSSLLLGLFIAVSWQEACADNSNELLQMQQCLAQKLDKRFPILAENKEFAIIEAPSAAIPEIAILADNANCGRFVNLTAKINGKDAEKKSSAQQLLQKKNTPFPQEVGSNDYKIQHPEAVRKTLALVKTETIEKTLQSLTDFYNRYSRNENGKITADWLKGQVDALAQQYQRDDTHSWFIKTPRYKQPSLVFVIGKDAPGPGIVIGAHMDTLDGRMPGAGDDGSGSSSLMATAEALLASGYQPDHPIYLIWYAAEEMGLVGSQYVVDDFTNSKRSVKAAMQLDMTGYRPDPKNKALWLFKDYTNKSLTSFAAELIQYYVKVPVSYSKCGYGCSDHASWYEAGIPAVFPCESSFPEHNPNIHTENDKMEWLSHEHMTNFSKLAVAFAIELASD